MTRALLEHIKIYSKLGWHMLPIAPPVDAKGGKIPLFKGWQQLATPSQTEASSWFEKYPHANIGIMTGKKSRLLVVDVDKRNGGIEGFNNLQQKYGLLPNKFVVVTGGGGFHHYFLMPEGHNEKYPSRLTQGIDIKCEGGFVVAPPSIHASGAPYSWNWGHESLVEDTLEEPPMWLTNLLLSKKHETLHETFRRGQQEYPIGKISSGCRNETLTSVFGHLLSHRVDPCLAMEMLHSYNNDRCDPPVSCSEVSKIIESIGEKEWQRRGMNHA